MAAKDAFAAFKELVARFPNSKYSEDAKMRMQFILNNLSRSEIKVADFYFKKGAYVAAINRAQSTIAEYPDVPSNEEALKILKPKNITIEGAVVKVTPSDPDLPLAKQDINQTKSDSADTSKIGSSSNTKPVNAANENEKTDNVQSDLNKYVISDKINKNATKNDLKNIINPNSKIIIDHDDSNTSNIINTTNTKKSNIDINKSKSDDILSMYNKMNVIFSNISNSKIEENTNFLNKLDNIDATDIDNNNKHIDNINNKTNLTEKVNYFNNNTDNSDNTC
jgi:hypothetical protein